MAHGLLYRVAVIVLRRLSAHQGHLMRFAQDEAASRAPLAWRLSHPMDPSFRIAARDEALARHRKPKICNTDQGSLPGLDPGITRAAFTGKLAAADGALAMDGRGRFMANILIERLCRSIKYEQIRGGAITFSRHFAASYCRPVTMIFRRQAAEKIHEPRAK